MNPGDNDDKPVQSNDRLAVALLVLAGMAVFLLAVAAWVGTVPAWTGFRPFDPDVGGPRARSLWEWLELLIVPAVLALGALWFNRSQKRLEIKLARESRDLEQKIATDRQQQAALEAYYDRMTELLLNHDLRGSPADAEARSIACALTLAVLRVLDDQRKTQAFQFLQEARLVLQPEPVVWLTGADLSGADLSYIILAGAQLSNVNLTGTNLSYADLSRSSLFAARLIGADLRGVDLSEASLTSADLSGSWLNTADLTNALMHASKLPGANLSAAKLIKANLRFADLTGASLLMCDLSEADLTMAKMHGANLRLAKLGGANLTMANLDETNLYRVSYTQATIWPEGFDPVAVGAVLVDGPPAQET